MKESNTYTHIVIVRRRRRVSSVCLVNSSGGEATPLQIILLTQNHSLAISIHQQIAHIFSTRVLFVLHIGHPHRSVQFAPCVRVCDREKSATQPPPPHHHHHKRIHHHHQQQQQIMTEIFYVFG